MKKFMVAALVAGSLFIAAPAQAHGSHYRYLRFVNHNSAFIRTIPRQMKLDYGHLIRKMLIQGFSPTRLVRECDKQLPYRACLVYVVGTQKHLF